MYAQIISELKMKFVNSGRFRSFGMSLLAQCALYNGDLLSVPVLKADLERVLGGGCIFLFLKLPSLTVKIWRRVNILLIILL